MQARSWLKIAICLVGGLYLAPPVNSMQWQRGESAPLSLLEQSPSIAAQEHPETVMVSALKAIREDRLNDADKLIDALLATRPNYRLAHLVKGDLLMAHAQPISGIGSAQINDDKLDDLRREAYVRLARYSAPPPTGLIPGNLLQLTAAQRYAVVVDATHSRV